MANEKRAQNAGDNQGSERALYEPEPGDVEDGDEKLVSLPLKDFQRLLKFAGMTGRGIRDEAEQLDGALVALAKKANVPYERFSEDPYADSSGDPAEVAP